MHSPLSLTRPRPRAPADTHITVPSTDRHIQPSRVPPFLSHAFGNILPFRRERVEAFQFLDLPLDRLGYVDPLERTLASRFLYGFDPPSGHHTRCLSVTPPERVRTLFNTTPSLKVLDLLSRSRDDQSSKGWALRREFSGIRFIPRTPLELSTNGDDRSVSQQ